MKIHVEQLWTTESCKKKTNKKLNNGVFKMRKKIYTYISRMEKRVYKETQNDRKKKS